MANDNINIAHNNITDDNNIADNDITNSILRYIVNNICTTYFKVYLMSINIKCNSLE